MSITFCCGAECGFNGSGAGGATNGTRHWTAKAGSPTVPTTNPRPNSGPRSYHFSTASAAAVSLTRAPGGNQNVRVLRAAIYFVALPSADLRILWINASAGTTPAALQYRSATQDLVPAIGAIQGATGFPVTTGVWYVVDLKAVLNTNPRTVSVQVTPDATGVTTDLGSASSSETGSNSTLFIVGITETGANADLYVDDILEANAATDYPLGNGHVYGISPTRDGAHSFSSGDFKYNDATAIDPAATDVSTYLDEVPIGTITDFISQNVVNALSYVEVGFAAPPRADNPRVVNVVHTFHASGTLGHAFSWKLNDGGTILSAQTGLSVAFVTAVHDIYISLTAPSGGAWTYAKLAALLYRVGYASAITSTPYIDGLMLEVEWPGEPIALVSPTADVAAGSWTTETGATTGLYASVDEGAPPTDATYIQSSTSPAADRVKLTLGVASLLDRTKPWTLVIRHTKTT